MPSNGSTSQAYFQNVTYNVVFGWHENWNTGKYIEQGKLFVMLNHVDATHTHTTLSKFSVIIDIVIYYSVLLVKQCA